MATIRYTAKVKDSRLLELPEAAQDLGLIPGEEVEISLNRNDAGQTPAFPPNGGMVAALRRIEERQKDRHFSDDTDSLKLLHETRAGAMYDYDPIE